MARADYDFNPYESSELGPNGPVRMAWASGRGVLAARPGSAYSHRWVHGADRSPPTRWPNASARQLWPTQIITGWTAEKSGVAILDRDVRRRAQLQNIDRDVRTQDRVVSLVAAP